MPEVTVEALQATIRVLRRAKWEMTMPEMAALLRLEKDLVESLVQDSIGTNLPPTTPTGKNGVAGVIEASNEEPDTPA